jgi:L-asparaginase
MRILFIQTGGTIDKDYPRTTKGYSFEITEPAVRRILERINPTFEYRIIPLLQKDSLDLTEDDRQRIVQECQKRAEDRIIITHGTDTMIETAKALRSLKGKHIVLTGAMRPEKFSDSDAPFNIGLAVGAVSTLPCGVYIAMHGKVHPFDVCTRNPSTGQFVSPEAD